VHDELDFSVPKSKLGTEAILEVKRIMENCMKLAVPVRCDLEIGPNWGEIK
jgi:DNA polymerase-1